MFWRINGGYKIWLVIEYTCDIMPMNILTKSGTNPIHSTQVRNWNIFLNAINRSHIPIISLS